MSETTFKEAIESQNFTEAEEMIHRGDDLLKSQWQFKLSDTFAAIVRKGAFQVLHALIEKNHIDLDIFEYDSFKDTLFLALATNLSDTEEALSFLSDFIPQVENLNDSLEGQTWLALAFKHGTEPSVIQTLIDNGCEVNTVTDSEQNFLHLILRANERSVSPERRIAYFQLCLDQGIDVDKPDLSGETPLHFAIRGEHHKLVDLLIENGANPNLVNKEGKTAYYLAIVEQGHWELCQQMNEQYPIDLEVETGRKTNLLYDYTKGVFSTLLSPANAQVLNFLADQGADPREPAENDYGELETTEDLVLKKTFEFFEQFFKIFPVDAETSDNDGNTLLHKVCGFQLNFDAALSKDIYRKAKFLISCGADVNATNNQDQTPLMLASDDNLKEKTVALLLKSGA